jgi:hypothetical protein
MAYLNGHSYVAFIGDTETLTGAFELHHVPPGSYDLVLVTPNLQDVVASVQVVSGQVSDVGVRDLCFPD